MAPVPAPRIEHIDFEEQQNKAYFAPEEEHYAI